MNVESSSSLKITGDITLSVWVKFIEGGNGNPRIISHGWEKGWELLTGKTAGSRVGFFHGGNKHRTVDGTFKGDDSWVHILALKKGTEFSLFVNGVKNQIGNNTGEPKQVGFSSSLDIGRVSGRDGDHFKGSVDDVRIYNRALTEEQVKALYEWEKPKAE